MSRNNVAYKLYDIPNCGLWVYMSDTGMFRLAKQKNCTKLLQEKNPLDSLLHKMYGTKGIVDNATQLVVDALEAQTGLKITRELAIDRRSIQQRLYMDITTTKGLPYLPQDFHIKYDTENKLKCYYQKVPNKKSREAINNLLKEIEDGSTLSKLLETEELNRLYTSTILDPDDTDNKQILNFLDERLHQVMAETLKASIHNRGIYEDMLKFGYDIRFIIDDPKRKIPKYKNYSDYAFAIDFTVCFEYNENNPKEFDTKLYKFHLDPVNGPNATFDQKYEISSYSQYLRTAKFIENKENKNLTALLIEQTKKSI